MLLLHIRFLRRTLIPRPETSNWIIWGIVWVSLSLAGATHAGTRRILICADGSEDHYRMIDLLAEEFSALGCETAKGDRCRIESDEDATALLSSVILSAVVDLADDRQTAVYVWDDKNHHLIKRLLKRALTGASDNASVLNISELLRAASVSAGDSNLTIDWEYMNTNSNGGQFVPTRISRVVVAQFQNTCDFASDFLTLAQAADAWYEVDLAFVTTPFDLSSLSGSGGTFSGIDDVGTWVVALFFDNCVKPNPWFLSVCHPC